MAKLQKICPHLWFDDRAEEAANYYVSIFDDARVTRISRYSKAGQDQHKHEPGSVMTLELELAGQKFVALNGGPQFTFNEAVSFIVYCDSQAEIDHYWDKLSAGGKEVQCGWLKDRFGVSWQIVPRALPEMMLNADPVKAERAMAAMMKMKKLDIAALQRAYDG